MIGVSVMDLLNFKLHESCLKDVILHISGIIDILQIYNRHLINIMGDNQIQ